MPLVIALATGLSEEERRKAGQWLKHVTFWFLVAVSPD
ncbi:MAG: hypothetical protein ACJAR5_003911 [Pseudophaeobacter arcticus]|jgi:hypothetical protein